MSDYDTFPIGINPADGLTLPNGGFFTSYERHVPSLMSGSQVEWDRMAEIVFHIGIRKIQIEKYETFSDMFVLYEPSRIIKSSQTTGMLVTAS